MENKQTIYKKLLLIREGMPKLTKDGTNSFHKYNYVTEAQVMDALREQCELHNVLILPSSTGVESNADIVTVHMQYEIVDGDNPDSKVILNFPGTGKDSGDKALYKGYTGSYKYMAMKVFQLASDSDPENEGGANQLYKSNPSPRTQAPAQGSISPNTVKDVAVRVADSLPKMPGTFYYKVPWEEKDEWNPVLKRARARWNPGNKHWESNIKIVGMDRFWINKPKAGQPEPTQVAFSMDNEPPEDSYDPGADDEMPNL